MKISKHCKYYIDRKGERKRDRNDNYSEMPKDPKRKKDLLDSAPVIVNQPSSHSTTHPSKPTYISTTNTAEIGYIITSPSPTATTFPASNSPLTPTSSSSPTSLNNFQRKPQLNVEKISKITIKKQPPANHTTFFSGVQSPRDVMVKQYPPTTAPNKVKVKNEELVPDRHRRPSLESTTQQLPTSSVNCTTTSTNYTPLKKK